jgi:ABC-type multidrug transport system fused ATPase/permease subunit
MLLETLTSLGRTGVQKWIVDDVFVGGSYGKLPSYLVLFGTCLIAAPMLFTATAMVHHRIGYKLRVYLGKYVMEHLYRIPIPELYRERTARIVDYFTRDVYAIGEEISYQMPKGIQRIVSALILIAFIGNVSLMLLIMISLSSFAYIGLGKYFGGRVRLITRQVADKRSTLNVHIEEGISSTREVIAFHREAWEMNTYRRHFQTYYEAVMKEGKIINLQILLSHPLKWASTLIALGFGGYQVLRGDMTVGTLVVLWQFSSNLMDDYQQIFEYYLRGASMLAAIDGIRRVADMERVSEGTDQLHFPIRSLQLDRVCFSYSKDAGEQILKEMSVTIPVGKKIAIVGASGGGKSTISKLLVRFHEPSAGNILVNGIPLEQIDRLDWARRVGIVFQEPYFFPDTIRNNLLLGRSGISDERLLSLCEKMCIKDVISSFEGGLEREIGERGVTLSGGQRQRFALVRALAGDPEILILDEGTSALDLETERKIQQNLDRLRYGKTTIVIAHRLSTIQNADVIYVLDRGRVAEEGTHEELMAKPSIYRSLLEAQDEQPAIYK